MSGQGTWTTTNTSDSLTITFTPNENLDTSQSIIMIPFTGDQQDIILSEAKAVKIHHQKIQDLSIGSLNEATYHTK